MAGTNPTTTCNSASTSNPTSFAPSTSIGHRYITDSHQSPTPTVPANQVGFESFNRMAGSLPYEESSLIAAANTSTTNQPVMNCSALEYGWAPDVTQLAGINMTQLPYTYSPASDFPPAPHFDHAYALPLATSAPTSRVRTQPDAGFRNTSALSPPTPVSDMNMDISGGPTSGATFKAPDTCSSPWSPLQFNSSTDEFEFPLTVSPLAPNCRPFSSKGNSLSSLRLDFNAGTANTDTASIRRPSPHRSPFGQTPPSTDYYIDSECSKFPSPKKRRKY